MCKYNLRVSEPWNFESPNGANLLYGEVICVLNKNCIIFKSDTNLNIGGIDNNLILLKSRISDSLSLKDGKYHGYVNGAILLTDDFKGIGEPTLIENSKFVIVGSISEV